MNGLGGARIATEKTDNLYQTCFLLALYCRDQCIAAFDGLIEGIALIKSHNEKLPLELAALLGSCNYVIPLVVIYIFQLSTLGQNQNFNQSEKPLFNV